jgi:hypothetical protein
MLFAIFLAIPSARIALLVTKTSSPTSWSDSPAVAEEFAKADPYVLNGIVKRWYVREWTTVVGEGSANPKRPAAVPSTT